MDLETRIEKLTKSKIQLVHLGQGRQQPEKWSAGLRSPLGDRIGLGWGLSPLQAIENALQNLESPASPPSLEDLGL